MSSAELLPLLREIEKRGGPMRVEQHTFDTAGWDSWRVILNGSWKSSWVGLDAEIPWAGEWAIVGALMEDMAAKAKGPKLDAMLVANSETREESTLWSASTYNWERWQNGDAVRATCRAWLAAHPGTDGA